MRQARPIHRLLIANRGEIARRVMRTCERLGIETVAVFSDVDADAPFVREADHAIPLGGSSAAESYLRVDAIIDAAHRAGADAIHPGYGFLSENADFAQRVVDEGLVWVGPPAAAIAAMGSKIEARERMEQIGVPVLPGATLDDHADAATLADGIGYPVLVKASAGGGGKGMRVVRDPGRLADAVAAAAREALAAFGDSALFLERYVDSPRHVEIQIFGDSTGQIVALHERECSIQRRHQKVIEECPSPVVDAALRARMTAAAIAAGESIGYEGAGTVEFLLTTTGGTAEFFFLEVNTRLQVEHPVTELVTGLDLVELQLLVAEGEPLPAAALHPALDGHAIEARLCAEDPANDYLPQTGVLARFRIPGSVRVDTGVQDGSEVTIHYDPMLAKLVAHAPTRAAAARALGAALRRAQIHGVTTNRELLVGVLAHPAFLAGATDTHFLDRHGDEILAAAALAPEHERVHAAAAVLAAQAQRRETANVLGGLPSGWRNNPSQPVRVTLAGRRDEITVGYRFDRRRRLTHLELDGTPQPDVHLHECTPHAVDLELGGVRRRLDVHRSGDRIWVDSALGSASFLALPRFPEPGTAEAEGLLTSPMPGMVLRISATEGEVLQKGQPLLVIEAMKMEHEIVAPSAGTLLRIAVAEGGQVDTGSVLVEIEPPAAAGPDPKEPKE